MCMRPPTCLTFSSEKPESRPSRGIIFILSRCWRHTVISCASFAVSGSSRRQLCREYGRRRQQLSGVSIADLYLCMYMTTLLFSGSHIAGYKMRRKTAAGRRTRVPIMMQITRAAENAVQRHAECLPHCARRCRRWLPRQFWREYLVGPIDSDLSTTAIVYESISLHRSGFEWLHSSCLVPTQSSMEAKDSIRCTCLI